MNIKILTNWNYSSYNRTAVYSISDSQPMQDVRISDY